MPGFLDMVLDDIDMEASISGTWSFGGQGHLIHKPTGMAITSEGLQMPKKDVQMDNLLLNDIELLEHLGQGAGGSVQKARVKTTGLELAVKVVNIDDKAKRNQMVNEIQALILTQGCSNCTQLYSCCSTHSGQVKLILEYCDLGNLQYVKRRSPLPEPILAQVSLQIMKGLKHLHDSHIIHRDIKLENILVTSRGEIKLTDFGISKDIDSTVAFAATFVGTSLYMSPERVAGEDYSFSSDLWGLGMVLYEMATGHYAYKSAEKSFADLYDCLIEHPEPQLPDTCSEELKDFLSGFLQKDPTRRKDCSTLLQHRFLQIAASQEELAQFLR